MVARPRALRLQAIGSLLHLRQDLLDEPLSLSDPIDAGPQDLANDIEDNPHLFGVLPARLYYLIGKGVAHAFSKRATLHSLGPRPDRTERPW